MAQNKSRLTGHLNSDIRKIRVQSASAGGGGVTDHGALTGLTDDDHVNYVHLANVRTITAQHSFSPGAAQAPFLLGANAQSQLVIGLRADELDNSVIAGTGLTGGGALTGNVTLNIDFTDAGFAGLAGDGLVWDSTEIDVGAGDGINVNVNDIEVDVTDLIGSGLIEEATNNIALNTPGTLTGATANSAAGNHTHSITTTSDAAGTVSTILQGDSNGDIALRRLTIDDRLIHDGDANTYLEFTTDQIDFHAGGVNMVRIDEAAEDILAIGNLTDFVVYSDDFITEVARIDGATGDITTSGTISGSFGATTLTDTLTIQIGGATTDFLLLDATNNQDSYLVWQDNGVDEWEIYRDDSSNDLIISESGVASRMIFYNGGNVEVPTLLGVGVTPTSLMHIRGTSVQFRLDYDASNYVTVQVQNDGHVIWNAFGTDADMSFAPGDNLFLQPSGYTMVNTGNLGIGGGFAPTAIIHARDTTAPQFRLQYDATNDADFSVNSTGTLTARADLNFNLDTTTGDVLIRPGDDIILDPAGLQVDPADNYSVSLGQITKRYLALHAAELVVGKLIAHNVMSTIGGRLVVAPTTELVADLPGSISELVTNPGFETPGAGDPDFWANWVETAGDGALANETTIVHGGNDAAKLTAGATTNTVVRQNVAVTAGDLMSFSVWTRGDGTYGGRYSLLDVTNARFLTPTTATGITGTTYTQIWDSFRVPPGCTSVQVSLWCPSTNTGVVYFDDVSMYESAIHVKHQNLIDGDIAYMEDIGQIEFVLVGAGGSAVYGGSELVLNPGFESATAHDFDNWTEDTDGGKSIITQDSGSVHSGTYSCKITTETGGSIGTVHQTMTVTALTYYRLTFWTRGSGSDDGKFLVYDMSNFSNIIPNTQTQVIGTSYKQLEVEFLTPANCTSVRIYFYCSGTAGEDVWFDDASLLAEVGEDYEYAIARNLDGSGLNTWIAGSALVNTQQPGDGFIDLYSETGISNGIGPSIVGNIRDSTAYNGWAPHFVLGQMDGVYGYSGSTVGLGLGHYGPGTAYITIDESNGLRIFSNANLIGQWDTAGNLTLGKVATNSGNAFWNQSNSRMEFRGGTAGTVVEAYIDTDGSIAAGGGLVWLDSDGVNFTSKTSYGHAASRINFLTPVEYRSGTQIDLGFIEGTEFQNGFSSSGMKWTLDLVAGGHTKPYVALYSEDTLSDSEVNIQAGGWLNLNASYTSLDQDTSDGHILDFQSSDVAHGATHIASTDTFGSFEKAAATAGGLSIQGLRDADASGLAALRVEGYLAENASTTKSTSGYGIVMISGKQTSGAANANTVANGNVVSFHTHRTGTETTIAILDEDGDLHVNGGSPVSTFDSFDDIQLARALDYALDPALIIDESFADWIETGKRSLAQTGIVTYNDDGGHFLNTTKLQRLHNGAIWQLHQENQELRQRLEQLEARIT